MVHEVEKLFSWKGDNLSTAHNEVLQIAQWARQVNMSNVAPRLEYAAGLLKEEISKRGKGGQS